MSRYPRLGRLTKSFVRLAQRRAVESPPPAADTIDIPGVRIQGTIPSDQTWGGFIVIRGTVIVPPGITLTLSAGSKVFLCSDGGRVFHERRLRGGRARPILPPGRISGMIVHGRLVAEGRADSRIWMKPDESWGGIHFLGRSSGSFKHVDLVNQSEEGIVLWDQSHVRLDSVRLAQPWAAVTAHGLSVAEHSNCYPSQIVAVRSREAGMNGAARAARYAWHKSVLLTRRWPVFRSAYQACAALAVRLMAGLLRSDARVAWGAVGRGWARGEWEPGVSDLDFIVIAREIDRDWLLRFWNRYAALKSLLPFLGEVVVATLEDARIYLDAGARREEVPHLSRTLAGERPPQASAACGRREALIEASHAYTRLMAASHWSVGSPPEFVHRQALKAAADCLRHLAVAAGRLEAQDARSRDDFMGSLPELGLGEFSGLFSRAPRPWDERRRALLTARILRGFHASLPLVAEPPAFDGSGAGNLEILGSEPSRETGDAQAAASRLGSVERLRRCFRGELSGALMDDLYRSYVILDDAAAERLSLGEVAAWERRWVRDPLTRPSSPPILLSERLWRYWSRLPYLECPTWSLERGGAPDAGQLRSFRGFHQFQWGGASSPASPSQILRGARESAANLRWIWRLMGSRHAPFSGAYTAHYLLSRGLGLRLILERGVAMPFFDLDAILARSAREFPDLAPSLAAIAVAGPADGREVLSRHYELFDRLISRLSEPSQDPAGICACPAPRGKPRPS